MLADKRLELAYQRCVTIKSEIDIDPLLLTCAAKLLEAGDLALRERLVKEVKKSGAPPEGKSVLSSWKRRGDPHSSAPDGRR